MKNRSVYARIDGIGKIGRKTVRCGGQGRITLLPNGKRKICMWNGCWIENGKMVHYKDGKVVPPPGERTERPSTRSVSVRIGEDDKAVFDVLARTKDVSLKELFHHLAEQFKLRNPRLFEKHDTRRR